MSKRKTHEEYVLEVASKNPNIEVVGNYIDAKTPILHRCKIDGHEWHVHPNNILNYRGCPVCSGRTIGRAPKYLNSIWASEYRTFFSQYMTEEQMKSIMPHCGKKINLLCPNCSKPKMISPNMLIRQGFGCVCGDGQSFPNKFVYNVLTQLKLETQQEYSPEWAGRFRYDEYLNKYNIIIENHGIQHYEEFPLSVRTLVEEQQNDIAKYNLAKENGINEYVVINCKKPTMEWIKSSIMQSRLPQILNFTESDIDWTQSMAYASHNLIKDAAMMFNDGMRVSDIAIELQKDSHTITKWLKRATQIGWCVYTPKKPCQIYCIEMNMTFSSKSAAARATHTSAASINRHIKGDYQYAGRHPQTNEPLHWEEMEIV